MKRENKMGFAAVAVALSIIGFAAAVLAGAALTKIPALLEPDPIQVSGLESVCKHFNSLDGYECLAGDGSTGVLTYRYEGGQQWVGLFWEYPHPLADDATIVHRPENCVTLSYIMMKSERFIEAAPVLERMTCRR